MKEFKINFENIASIDNLLEAWKEFVRGKRGKMDVQEFSFCLMDNIFLLHRELIYHIYRHGGYQAFRISDPKPRNIHKATVRDRLLHHAIYRILYPYFDNKFIADSFSCRLNKGTHKALNRFREFGYKTSRNNTRTCWILKCDIKKFFVNINHFVLMDICKKQIQDKNILWLVERVINSFYIENKKGVGLPLGNLTSQLFANVYMNVFDQFVKHKLKVGYYIRYADDFVIFSENRIWLENQISPIKNFLRDTLKLELHPQKVFIKSYASGVDFLGWVHFPRYRQLRTVTKRRMLKNMRYNPKPETVASYRGLLKWGNTFKLKCEIIKLYSGSFRENAFPLDFLC
ncbi:MAG: reverse transcriptase/maturase family protein [Patescibacteria group bacterium]|nr:reverse transcriptase/maturase family protein [Patescibacteria group bacterium]